MRKLSALFALATCIPSVIAGNGTEGPTPFIRNLGQWAAPFSYQASAGNLTVFLEPGALTWSLLQPDYVDVLHDAMHEGGGPVLAGHAWRVHFDGAGSSAMEAEGRSELTTNYMLGNDPDRWKSGVASYGAVRYTEPWAGVSMRFYQQEGSFKYDLTLQPGADEQAIDLRYEGLDGLAIDRNGDLLLSTSQGVIRELAPVAWYADNIAEKVACRYVLNKNVVSYELVGADRSRGIVIDPILIASTLSGTGDIGTTTNYGHSAAYDLLGNIYTGARCFGQGYPVTLGAFQSLYGGGNTDMALSKLNSDGSQLIWATYVGGSGMDIIHSLFADDAGTLYAMGSSTSTDFPVTANAYDGSHNGDVDMVVLRIQDDGASLIGSTYMGGSLADGYNAVGINYGDSYRGEIIIDGSGNCYVTGPSSSTDLPTTTGAWQTGNAGGQDGAVFCFNGDMSALLWSTYIGGAQNDMAYGLRLDGTGGVYICGSTGSPALPTTSGAYQASYQGGDNDGYIIHLGPNAGTLLASTFFGTSERDDLFFLDMDGAGNVYVYGQTDGTIAIQPVGTYGMVGGDICLGKFDAGLSMALFTSVLGAASPWGYNLVPVAFMVDLCGHPCISGYSAENGLPTTPDLLYAHSNENRFYIGVFDVGMTGLLYGTYYTGDHVDAGTSHFDPNGIVYQAVCTSGGFPTTPNAWSNTQPAGWEVAVFKIDLEQAGCQVYMLAPPQGLCSGLAADFVGNGNAVDWEWDFGDGTGVFQGQVVSHAFAQPGGYVVKLRGTDPATCNVSDSLQWVVEVDICSGLGTLVDDDVPFTVWYNGTSFELVNAGWNDGPVEMEVFSLSGGLVNRERVSVSGGRATLPAVAVASGLYTIRVVGATSTMQRVVVP